MHGGNAGPKTPAGKIRSAEANWKHGFYSREAIEDRKKYKQMLKWQEDLD